MDKQKKTFIINALRRSTYKWPGRWIAEKRSHLKELKRYWCESCGSICRKKDTIMDHINPVIPVEKTTESMSIDEIADRMLVPPESWQRLCIDCNYDKTQGENKQRPKIERKRKKKP